MSTKCLLVLLLVVALFTTLCLADEHRPFPKSEPPHKGENPQTGHKPPTHGLELKPQPKSEHKPLNPHEKPPSTGDKPPRHVNDLSMAGEMPPLEHMPTEPHGKQKPPQRGEKPPMPKGKGEKPPPKKEGGRKLMEAVGEAKPFFPKGHDRKPMPPKHHPGHPPEKTGEVAKKPLFPPHKPPTSTAH